MPGPIVHNCAIKESPWTMYTEKIHETLNTMDYDEQYEVLKHLEKDIKEEQDIATKSAILMKMLEDPSMDTLPVVYVEESNDVSPPFLDEEEDESISATPEKRSRYYRRYPWKRHSRNRGCMIASRLFENPLQS
uniref:Uncharacterized protein n=1 Tax=Megaselia scalaris TaxID=36166 RepID=T1GRW4_MEGSC